MGYRIRVVSKHKCHTSYTTLGTATMIGGLRDLAIRKPPKTQKRQALVAQSQAAEFSLGSLKLYHYRFADRLDTPGADRYAY